MSMCTMYAWYQEVAKELPLHAGTGVTHGCKPPCVLGTKPMSSTRTQKALKNSLLNHNFS